MTSLWNDPFGMNFKKTKTVTAVVVEKPASKGKEKPPSKAPCAPPPHSICYCVNYYPQPYYPPMFPQQPCVCHQSKPTPPPPPPKEEKKKAHKCVLACTPDNKCAACKKAEEPKKVYYVVPSFSNPRTVYRVSVMEGKSYTTK
ncbi:hypothetical protein RMATCC62417_12923 [Rhizopus microsporus]|nr:hypothetical protein RMATCC62417_12923 [Rhizopus microsporus]